jgi:hypothetical protein
LPAIYQFELPIPTEDLKLVQDMIRNARLLTIFDASNDPADALLYRTQESTWRTESRALIDLNVLKDILSVVRPGDRRSSEARRLGAAFVAFCQCANITIEPAIALHESPRSWREELQLFRSIDNAETTDLVKVALGELEQIPRDSLHELQIEALPREMPERLRGHAALQTAMLKLALIGRTRETTFHKLESFLDWSFHQYLFSREVIHLALFHLTGNSPDPILKKTRAHSPNDRLAALDNAVWDLMLVRTWVKNVAEQKDRNRIWILCTRDKGLQGLAREMMIANAGDGEVAKHLEGMFMRACGLRDAKKLYGHYQQLMGQAEDLNRPSNKPGFGDYCESLNASLLAEYLGN